MRVKLSDLLSVEVLAALRAAGFDVVKVGDVPPWMERCPSMRADLYRLKELDD